jgi:hypothetical protein
MLIGTGFLVLGHDRFGSALMGAGLGVSIGALFLKYKVKND